MVDRSQQTFERESGYPCALTRQHRARCRRFLHDPAVRDPVVRDLIEAIVRNATWSLV